MAIGELNKSVRCRESKNFKAITKKNLELSL